ncbi:MAG TPA: hypothetical protein VFP49_03530 [Nitrososphaeraceae archaeon]|nr:hypothetical protein [Nitrososphaeraceae archaeon]
MFDLFDKDKLHMDDNSKASFLVPVIIFFMAGTGISNILFSDCCPIVFASADTNNNNNNSSSSSIIDNGSYTFVEQKTVTSQPAPVRHPGQPSHEVVFALPLRDDGKVWSGTVTFTASKPIEVEILHTYAPEQKPNSLHGEPYHAVLPGNKSIAITHLRDIVDVPIEINGTGISSGSVNFVGNALVFHKTNGEPFTVTYTIDAKVKDIGINK